jgi:hypothetical protein
MQLSFPRCSTSWKNSTAGRSRAGLSILTSHRVVAVRISGERRDCGKGWEKLKSEVGIAPHKLLEAGRENLRLR